MVLWPVLLSCSLWCFQVFISLFKLSPWLAILTVSRLPRLLPHRRKTLFTTTSSSSFHSVSTHMSAISGVGWGARRLLSVPRPIPPPHSHVPRRLAPFLSLPSHVSSTFCWSLTQFSPHINRTQSPPEKHRFRVHEGPSQGSQLSPEHRSHRGCFERSCHAFGFVALPLWRQGTGLWTEAVAKSSSDETAKTTWHLVQFGFLFASDRKLFWLI